MDFIKSYLKTKYPKLTAHCGSLICDLDNLKAGLYNLNQSVKYYNEQDIESIDTIFGSVEIQERNKEFEKELKEYLQKEQNKKDLNSHIDILYQALKRYKEESDKLLCNK